MLWLRIDKHSQAVTYVIGCDCETISKTTKLYISYERAYFLPSFDNNIPTSFETLFLRERHGEILREPK